MIQYHRFQTDKQESRWSTDHIQRRYNYSGIGNGESNFVATLVVNNTTHLNSSFGHTFIIIDTNLILVSHPSVFIVQPFHLPDFFFASLVTSVFQVTIWLPHEAVLLHCSSKLYPPPILYPPLHQHLSDHWWPMSSALENSAPQHCFQTNV